MIVCPRCSKENQPHYKFCLGCGSELPRGAAQAPSDFRPPTGAMSSLESEASKQEAPKQRPKADAAPKPGKEAVLQTSAAGGTAAAAGEAAPSKAKRSRAKPAQAKAAAATSTCPNCGADVPADFKFCGKCGSAIETAGDAAAAAPTSAAASAPRATDDSLTRGQLVLINPDGSEGESYELQASETKVGRDTGGPFAMDSYLSPQHATLTFERDRLRLRDDDSLNGVYVRLAPQVPVELTDGDVIRIGQEILKFERVEENPTSQAGVQSQGSPNPGYMARVSLIVGPNATGNAFPIGPHGIHMGRERGDVLFPEDGYVSGLHCRIYRDKKAIMLADVGSSNGTFLRVRGETTVAAGDMILMGQQLFRVDF